MTLISENYLYNHKPGCTRTYLLNLEAPSRTLSQSEHKRQNTFLGFLRAAFDLLGESLIMPPTGQPPQNLALLTLVLGVTACRLFKRLRFPDLGFLVGESAMV